MNAASRQTARPSPHDLAEPVLRGCSSFVSSPLCDGPPDPDSVRTSTAASRFVIPSSRWFTTPEQRLHWTSSAVSRHTGQAGRDRSLPA